MHYDVRDVDLVMMLQDIERQRGVMKAFHVTSCREYKQHLLQVRYEMKNFSVYEFCLESWSKF